MRLLLIEEDEAVAASVKRVLDADFTVDVAYTGSSGFRMALRGHYTLILMDLMLPGKETWKISEAIRSGRCSSYSIS